MIQLINAQITIPIVRFFKNHDNMLASSAWRTTNEEFLTHFIQPIS